MKKLLLIFLSCISLAGVADFNENRPTDSKNFEQVSTKYAYAYATNNKQAIVKYYNMLRAIDKKRADEFKNELLDVDKILIRVFKTYKNLVPKIIHNIYFESISSDDINIQKEVDEKIIIAFLANEGANIYINNIDGSANSYVEKLVKYGASKDKIHVLQKDAKQVLIDITNDIKKSTGKTKFGTIEQRVMIVVSTDQVKQRLALAHAIFNKELSGVEIDDFSYVISNRKTLESTTNELRLKSFEQFIDGKY